jgi:pseudaminic acid synthase
MKIGNFDLTKSTFIIAELSCNHLGNLDLAKKTIEEIAKTGANAVKLQTEAPINVTLESNDDEFMIKGGAWNGQSLYELFKKTYTPFEWHYEIKELVEKLGMIFFSTPGGLGNEEIINTVDFLENLNVPCYKISSFELVDIPLIRYVAKKGKPIIMSTGVANFEDIKLAVETCKEEDNDQIILLKCTSAYPTALEDVNLKQMKKISDDFNCLVGISDHSLFNEVAISSVAMGGCVIEKHVILDRKLGGPDSGFSMEPHEFKAMVESVRNVEKLLGRSDYKLQKIQKESRRFMRSLYVVKDVMQGEIVTTENVRSVRPGFGIHPKYLDIINPDCILGKKFAKNKRKNTNLQINDII